MSKKIPWLVAIGLVAVVVVVLIVMNRPRGNPQEITIGAILPLTGQGAAYGEAAKRGMDLAVQQVNSEGGIDGRTLRIVYEDSQGEPKSGVAAFQKLITVDRVPAVLGDLLSSVTLSIAPIANRREVVLLSPASSSPKLTDAGQYVFRNCPSDVYEGTVMADYAFNTLGYRRVAILRINNEYGVGIGGVFRRSFTDKGGTIVAEESYAEDATDFRTQITKIAGQNPEAVYLLGYKQMGYILRQAKELGFKTQFLSTVTFEDPEILKLGGAATEGVIYSASKFSPDSGDEVIRRFVNAYESLYQSKPNIFAGLSYDAVRILAIAMRDGGTDSNGIRAALHRINKYPGVAGETTIDSHGDAVLTPVLKTVRDGKFVFVE
ncbi:MAG: penicillin-binding protein activator [Phycisphaerae bacterium]|jgi:branched-chain amino acid transport system substrate-binding protein